MNRREQILENCRWLFDQEVQIILFERLKGSFNSYAIVLPKACTARTLANLDFNEHILISAESESGTIPALDRLSLDVEERISEILQVGSDGLFQVNKLAIPAKYSKDNDDTTVKPEDTFRIRRPKAKMTKVDTEQESDSQPVITIEKRNRRKGEKERVGEHEPRYASSGGHVIGYASGAEPSGGYSPSCIKAPEKIDTEPPLLSAAVPDGGEGFQIENQSVNHELPFKVEHDTSTTCSKTDPNSNRSVLNDMPTAPRPEPSSSPNLDRKLIREEINLALRGILSDMVMQITLQPEETHRSWAGNIGKVSGK